MLYKAADTARVCTVLEYLEFHAIKMAWQYGYESKPVKSVYRTQRLAVGFKVTIRQLENSTFLSRVFGPRHDFTAAVAGISGDPGLGFLRSLDSVTGIAIPADPVLAQRVFADQLPVVWLYHARGVQAMSSRVRGVRMDIRGELPTVAAWRVTP